MGLFRRNSSRIEISNKEIKPVVSETRVTAAEKEEQILNDFLPLVDDGSGNFRIEHRTPDYTTLFYQGPMWLVRLKWTQNVQWAVINTVEGEKKITMHSEHDLDQYADTVKEFYTFLSEMERKRQEKKNGKAK